MTSTSWFFGLYKRMADIHYQHISDLLLGYEYSLSIWPQVSTKLLTMCVCGVSEVNHNVTHTIYRAVAQIFSLQQGMKLLFCCVNPISASILSLQSLIQNVKISQQQLQHYNIIPPHLVYGHLAANIKKKKTCGNNSM